MATFNGTNPHDAGRLHLRPRGRRHTSGWCGNDVIRAGSAKAANRIEGNGGDDRIDGGSGNDVLAGGSGSDRFIFEASDIFGKGQRPFSSGHDVILDFSLADKIDLLCHVDATSFAALTAGTRQMGEDVIITLGDDPITLDNFEAAELIPAMFLF